MKNHTFTFGDEFARKYILFLFILTKGEFYENHRIIVSNAI